MRLVSMVTVLLFCFLLGLMGCFQDAPLHGRVVVHLTNSGVVVYCEPLRPMDDTNQPSVCSPVDVKDERGGVTK